jgi:AraC-type DNA-binding domain-containing proteins
MTRAVESNLSPVLRERLLASRVTGSRYVFFNLAPQKRTRWSLALAGREECASDYLVNRERYPFHVFEYVAAGQGVVRLGDAREHKIGPGSIYAYGPEMSCYIRSSAGAPLTKFFFALAGRDAAAHLAAAKLPPGQVRRFAASAELLTTAEDVIHEGGRQGSYAGEIGLKLVEILLLKIADEVGHAAVGDDRARENFLRCRSIIEAHTAKLSSLEEISRAVGLEPESVCRLFRRFQGTSPYQYLLRRKMTLAAEFLVQSRGLVKEAAAQVGFDDPYHFARCFKAVHGVTPSQVRGFHGGEKVGV